MNFLNKKTLALAMILLLVMCGNTSAEEAREIMKKVLDRDDGYSQYSIQSIATCKYEITNKKIACIDKPRVKMIEMIQKDSVDNKKDSLSVMIIKKPKTEKGIGFLQYDFDAHDRDTDQWMYLSALGKIKRIVSGNDNEPKSGTLFGSEFGFEDTEKIKLDNYSYKLVKQVKYKGKNAWVIESKPTPSHARKSNYSKSVLWIDKDRNLMLRSKIYDRRGRLIKQMSFSQYEKIDNVWVARKMNMNNIQTKRISTMKLRKVALNIGVDDALMTQRTLIDGAFREKQLKLIRQKAQ